MMLYTRAINNKGIKMNFLQTAIFNARKFSGLEMSLRVAAEQKYWTPVLLGVDGKFWVPSTNREASALINAGLERAQ
jgi:hypothetical protein